MWELLLDGVACLNAVYVDWGVNGQCFSSVCCPPCISTGARLPTAIPPARGGRGVGTGRLLQVCRVPVQHWDRHGRRDHGGLLRGVRPAEEAHRIRRQHLPWYVGGRGARGEHCLCCHHGNHSRTTHYYYFCAPMSAVMLKVQNGQKGIKALHACQCFGPACFSLTNWNSVKAVTQVLLIPPMGYWGPWSLSQAAKNTRRR